MLRAGGDEGDHRDNDDVGDHGDSQRARAGGDRSAARLFARARQLVTWHYQWIVVNQFLPAIPPGRFQDTMKAFGQFEGTVHDLVLYAIDNEIHHRGQGYVYLRALGIEPPPFYERQCQRGMQRFALADGSVGSGARPRTRTSR